VIRTSTLLLTLAACGSKEPAKNGGVDATIEAVLDGDLDAGALDETNLLAPIPCWDSSCSPPEVCCVAFSKGEDPYWIFACTPNEACIGGQVLQKIACVGAANCAAEQACCVERASGSLIAACATDCGDKGRLCNTDAECGGGKCATDPGSFAWPFQVCP
jgi:hypothetical protein